MHQIFLTGASGYIGNLIYQNLSNLYSIKAIDRNNKEINAEALAENISPVIIYAAGNKDIKTCESNIEVALDANFHYLQSVVEKFINPYIIYISSDYVFNGQEGNYSVDHIPSPDTNYGKSKFIAENWLSENYLDKSNILRVSTVCSHSSSFIKYLLKASEEDNSTIEVADNSFFSPTSINLLLECLVFLIEERLHGIYHLSGPRTSRSEFAKLILSLYSKKSILKNQDYKLINGFLRPDLSLKNSFLDMKDFGSTTFHQTLKRVYSDGYLLKDFDEKII
tara:strand:+ start:497 stop:1336 length:840 start_codon:yes stop_codon:yes gene_type:complete